MMFEILLQLSGFENFFRDLQEKRPLLSAGLIA